MRSTSILAIFASSIPLFSEALQCHRQRTTFVRTPSSVSFQRRHFERKVSLRLSGALDEAVEGQDTDDTDDFRDSDGALVRSSFVDSYAEVLPSWLLEKCEECGWSHPTRIQESALNTVLLDQKDAIIQAQTGSGKTLAFLLPVLAGVDASRSAVQALIVVPTRELGLQVGRVAKRLAAASENDGSKIMVMTVLQGSQNRRQRAWAWAEPPQVVIGTPEELCKMIGMGGIKRYSSIKYVVVDEVDACLLNNAGTMTSNIASSTLHELLSKYLSPTFDDGSSSEAEDQALLSSTRKIPTPSRPVSQTRRTIFCSATIPQHRHFRKQCVQNKWCLEEPVHVSLRSGEQLMPPTLDHAYMVCLSTDKKLAVLRRIIKKLSKDATEKKIIIFAEPQRPLEQMAQVVASDVGGILWKENYGLDEMDAATAIVGVLRFEDSLSQRAAAIQAFRGEQYQLHGSGIPTTRSRNFGNAENDSKLRILFSTDLAARGLDISDVSHIIQLDLAPDADTYVHRAGRAGRMGSSGQVISIITPEQEFVLRRLANKLLVDVRCVGRQKQEKNETER